MIGSCSRVGGQAGAAITPQRGGPAALPNSVGDLAAAAKEQLARHDGTTVTVRCTTRQGASMNVVARTRVVRPWPRQVSLVTEAVTPVAVDLESIAFPHLALPV